MIRYNTLKKWVIIGLAFAGLIIIARLNSSI